MRIFYFAEISVSYTHLDVYKRQHITILSGIKVTAQTLLDNRAAYKDGYRAIDSATNFKLDEEAIQEFRKKLASNYEDTDEDTGKIRSALSEVSDISDVGMPDSNGVFDIHEQRCV